MARDIVTRQNTEPADGTNPFGKLRDESAPGASDGTPVNEALLNDIAIFFQKLLSEAGIAANEQPEDNVNGFQFFDAFRTLSNASSGGGGVNPTAEEFVVENNPVNLANPDIASLSESRVAVLDGSRNELFAFDYDGNSFTQVGNALSVGPQNQPQIAAISPNRVAVYEFNNDNLTAYEFDGNDWSVIGTPLNIPAIIRDVISISSNRVVLVNVSDNELQAYDFNGSNWVPVGTNLGIGSIGFASGVYLGNDQFVYYDTSGEEIRIYSFNGSNFALVGTPLNIGSIGGSAIAAITPTRIMIFGQGPDQIIFYDLVNGTTWIEVGERVNNVNGFTKLTKLTNSIIAAINSNTFLTYLITGASGNTNPF